MTDKIFVSEISCSPPLPQRRRRKKTTDESPWSYTKTVSVLRLFAILCAGFFHGYDPFTEIVADRRDVLAFLDKGAADGTDGVLINTALSVPGTLWTLSFLYSVFLNAIFGFCHSAEKLNRY